MDQIIIREAQLKDINTLLTFEQGIINTERDFDATLKPGEIRYYDLQKMINEENTMVAVAELNNQLIACGFARIEQSKAYLKHSHHAYLGLMFVRAEHRGKSINKSIIDFLRQWAVSRNITELRLEVYASNISAIQAYQKQGFAHHMIEMRMGINQSG